MKRNIVWILGVLVAFALGAGLAAYRVYDGTTRTLVRQALNKDARAVRLYVDVLQRLHADEDEEAMELLESWLDDNLIIVMEPSNYELVTDPRTIAHVDSAYWEARAYREAFPRTSDRSFVDEMVANVWEAGPPSQFP